MLRRVVVIVAMTFAAVSFSQEYLTLQLLLDRQFLAGGAAQLLAPDGGVAWVADFTDVRSEADGRRYVVGSGWFRGAGTYWLVCSPPRGQRCSQALSLASEDAFLSLSVQVADGGCRLDWRREPPPSAPVRVGDFPPYEAPWVNGAPRVR